MKFKKILKITLIVAGISIMGLVVYFIVGIVSLGMGSCQNQTISEINSAGNYYKAIYYSRDCGATTGGSSQIKLERLKNRKLFAKDDEVIFITDYDKGIRLEWTGENNLRVIYSGNDRIFKQLKSWDNIKIEYAPVLEDKK